MTRATPSGTRGSIAKLVVAGVFIGIPIAAVSVPAYAVTADTPSVLPAPLPAEPPTNEPAPPPHHQAPTTANETEDWWGYGMDAGGGGGGG